MDYFNARYYASMQGRFTSPDPLLASGRPASPQSWNRYSYVQNNPLKLVDPNGMEDQDPKVRKGDKTVVDETDPRATDPAYAVVEYTAPTSVDTGGTPVTTAVTPIVTSIQMRTTEEPSLEQRQAYYGTPDGEPDDHVAHDNDDFRKFNLTIPLPLPGVGVSLTYTWDKYQRHYFSVGPSVGLNPLGTASLQTGRTYGPDGQQVQDKDSVEKVLTGPSASVNICPVICSQGGWNVRHVDVLPRPTGGSTLSSGIGVPDASISKEWTWKLPF